MPPAHSVPGPCGRPVTARGAGEQADGCTQVFRNEAGHALEIWGTCFIARPQGLCALYLGYIWGGVRVLLERSHVFLLPGLLLGRTRDGCTFSFGSQDNVIVNVPDPELQLQASIPAP